MRRQLTSRPKPPASALAVAVLLLSFAGCGPDDLLGPDAPQGIDGIAFLGPLCPVQREDDPCPDRPHAANIDVRTPGGDLVTRVRSGADGRFRVGLRAGRYVLDPEPGDPFPVASTQDVEVPEGSWIEVTVLFDTGIR